ncbi:serine protease Do-like HtrB [Oppia nitens]|uniref:serine protease Do-like HtrB n=1 Tax=Oppia nitens TaxID=1686743 RepID=UPI0023DC69AA|nr:serine protease Do-like HtrB [Oppia nitens]
MVDSIDNLIDILMPKFVEIRIVGTDYRTNSYGTGCIILYESIPLVITNEHVVEKSGLAHIMINGETDWRMGRVLYTDHCVDLAVIAFDFRGAQIDVFDMAESGPSFGDPVVSLGFGTNHYSVGYGHVICPESLSIVRRLVSTADKPSLPIIAYIENSAAQSPGFSGGPLVNNSGQLTGVISMSRWYIPQHYSLAASDVTDFAENIGGFLWSETNRREGEHNIKLGLFIKWGGPQIGCMVIKKFIDSQGNENVNTFDIIVEINGQKIQSINHMTDMIDYYIDDEDIPVLIKHKGKLETINIQKDLLDLSHI